VRLLYGFLLATILTPGLIVGQTKSQPAPTPSDESDWLPKNPFGATAGVVKAPARAIASVFKHLSSSPPSQEPEARGVVAFEQLQASSSPLGAVFILDTNLGYAFTPHLTGDVGIPVFFIRSPFSKVSNKDWRWTTWLLGEPYLDVRYTTKSHGVSLTSILTGTIPVSSPERIFSTGRFGVDWFNHVEKGFKGLTPFVNFGAANGTVNRFVMPRPYSVARPYQTLGFMSDFEGGASYRFKSGFAIGASAYALVPGGPQKVFSRLVAPDFALAGNGDHNRYFDSAFEIAGSSDVARDNGFSGWIELTRLKHMNLQIGYTHSIHYALDTVTLMWNFDGSFLFKEPQQ
jgi:hypothetical protein